MECSICLELLQNNIAILDCIHKFHEDCISKWLSRSKYNKCPVCETGTEIVAMIFNDNDQLESLISRKNKKASITPVVKGINNLITSNTCKCICQ